MGRPVILERYPYTYLRTIVMKKNLLTRQDYDKIVKMSPGEIAKYLEDFEYKKEVDELALEYKGIELLERALVRNLGNKFEKLRRISPHDLRLLISLYLRRYDMYNIKTILRGKFGLLSPEEIRKYLSPLATMGALYFDRLIAQKTTEEVFGAVDFIEEKEKRSAVDHFRHHSSLALMEGALDRHYYSHVFSQLRYLTMEGKLYKRFLLNEVDVQNIKVMLRLKSEKVPEQAIRDVLLPFGTIKKEVLEKMLKADRSGILKELEATDFSEIVGKHENAQSLSISDLEMDLDRFLLQRSRRLIRQHPMSVDVILGYMFLKDVEVKNLERIAKAKHLGMDESFIERIVVV